jgi:hypothetical protein
MFMDESKIREKEIFSVRTTVKNGKNYTNCCVTCDNTHNSSNYAVKYVAEINLLYFVAVVK